MIDHDDSKSTLTYNLLYFIRESFPAVHIQWFGPRNDLLFHSFDIDEIITPKSMRRYPVHRMICLVINGDHPNNPDVIDRTNHNAFVIYRDHVHTRQQLMAMKRLHIPDYPDMSLEDLLHDLNCKNQLISQPQEMSHQYVSFPMRDSESWSELIRLFQLLMLSPTSMTRITCSAIFLTNMLTKQLLPVIEERLDEEDAVVVVVVPDQCPNEHRMWQKLKSGGRGECPSIVGDLLLEQTQENPMLFDKISMLERFEFPDYSMEQLHIAFPGQTHEWSHRVFKYEHKDMTIRKRNSKYHNALARESLCNRVPGLYILQETIAFHHCELLQGLDIIQLSPLMKRSNPNVHCCQIAPRTVCAFEDLDLSFANWVTEDMFNDVLFKLQLRDVIAVWWQVIGGWTGFVNYMAACPFVFNLSPLIPPSVNRRKSIDGPWAHEIKRHLDSVGRIEESPHLFLLKNDDVRSIVNPHFAARCRKSIRQGRIGAKCFLAVMEWLQKPPSSLPPLIPVHWSRRNRMFFPRFVSRELEESGLPDDLCREVLEYVWGPYPLVKYHMLLMEIGFVCMRQVKVSFGCTSMDKYQTRAQLLDPVEVQDFHKLIRRELES